MFVGFSRDGFHWHRHVDPATGRHAPFMAEDDTVVSREGGAWPWNKAMVQSVGGGFTVQNGGLMRFYASGRGGPDQLTAWPFPNGPPATMQLRHSLPLCPLEAFRTVQIDTFLLFIDRTFRILPSTHHSPCPPASVRTQSSATLSQPPGTSRPAWPSCAETDSRTLAGRQPVRHCSIYLKSRRV